MPRLSLARTASTPESHSLWKALGITRYRHSPAGITAIGAGLPCDGLELNWRHHQVVLTFPTNDKLVLCGIGVPQADFQQFRSDIEGNYLKAIARIPQLAERIHNAHREARFYGMADLPNFLRKPYGPGWALVGDAS